MKDIFSFIFLFVSVFLIGFQFDASATDSQARLKSDGRVEIETQDESGKRIHLEASLVRFVEQTDPYTVLVEPLAIKQEKPYPEDAPLKMNEVSSATSKASSESEVSARESENDSESSEPQQPRWQIVSAGPMASTPTGRLPRTIPACCFGSRIV